MSDDIKRLFVSLLGFATHRESKGRAHARKHSTAKASTTAGVTAKAGDATNQSTLTLLKDAAGWPSQFRPAGALLVRTCTGLACVLHCAKPGT